MRPVTCQRVLQFRAGPNEHTFYACDVHRAELENGTICDLFFGLDKDKIESADEEDGECYACRGEDGP